jgi:hypothetical protein
VLVLLIEENLEVVPTHAGMSGCASASAFMVNARSSTSTWAWMKAPRAWDHSSKRETSKLADTLAWKRYCRVKLSPIGRATVANRA